MPDYAAFISYSHQYKEWVLQLQKNLELCLEHHGAKPSKVFLDQVDLLPGRSWVGRLDEGLAKAERLILVITPEAMASPHVEDEWQAWIGRHATWQRDSLVVPVELIASSETPMTLAHIQRADFTVSTPEAYCDALQKVLGVVLGRVDARDLPDLSPGIVPPTLSGEGPQQPDELLARYLELVRQDHGRLLQLLGRSEESEPLEKVYVSLALQPDQGRQPSRDAAERFESHSLGPMSLRQLLELDPEQHPWITRRWVVRGDPGSGKTTLLRHLASKLAGEDEPAWIPVFFSLPRLVRDGGSPLDLIEHRLRRADMDEGARALFDELGRAGRLLILLDGLDEVPGEKREDAEDLLLGALQRWPDTPIVLSSRPIGYDRPHDAFREVDVQPLDREQQIEFLARRLRGEDEEPDTARALRELEILDEHASLDELARNPLYLTLMSFLIRDGATLTGSRSQLYDAIFELLLRGRHRKRRPSEKIEAIVKPQLVRRALQHLGYEMSRRNRDTARLDELEEHLESAQDLCRKLGKIRRWRDGLWQLLNDVAELTGILAPHDGEDEDWRYWHRTFREALAAEQLETLWQSSEEQVLAHARAISAAKDEEQDKSRWAEAYALLAGRLAEPDALVLALIEQDRELGLRAFEDVPALQEETLHQLFTNEAWQVRTAAYARLADLVADPDRALELIDELRQQTRKGNDLFFLDLAARRVGDRWPKASSAAAGLRARLYDHIPEPPAELFQWIDTSHDGRVPLWCEVPAGSFLMGSREDDEEAIDPEKPQHPVTVLSPYQMAAVPVTQEQYAAFDPDHASWFKGSQRPVDTVTWYEAVSFCRWLASFPWAAGARLPGEEEWEYACRAGTKTRFWNGDSEEDLEWVDWYHENSGQRTHRVGEKPANPWGLYDVHGNVWEWTATEWDAERYQDRSREEPFPVDPAAPTVDLAGSPRVGRVMRGGSCWDPAQGCRSAYRVIRDPGHEVGFQGFRVLLSSVPSRPFGDDDRTGCLLNDQDSGNRSSTPS